MIFEIQRDGKAAPTPLKTCSLTDEDWNEKDLENYLRQNLPQLISDDLMVISQSRPYQPEADLLGLDRQGDYGSSNSRRWRPLRITCSK
jgi:hypothetical protein